MSQFGRPTSPNAQGSFRSLISPLSLSLQQQQQHTRSILEALAARNSIENTDHYDDGGDDDDDDDDGSMLEINSDDLVSNLDDDDSDDDSDDDNNSSKDKIKDKKSKSKDDDKDDDQVDAKSDAGASIVSGRPESLATTVTCSVPLDTTRILSASDFKRIEKLRGALFLLELCFCCFGVFCIRFEIVIIINHPQFIR
eukprot:c12554_g5_i2.p1 GENE.c12554_g5_i2~~c12554_g5_i2.p1  ORF type:complete len:197 (-),score=56.11 c12554_g5_i2:80-670(-)